MTFLKLGKKFLKPFRGFDEGTFYMEMSLILIFEYSGHGCQETYFLTTYTGDVNYVIN